MLLAIYLAGPRSIFHFNMRFCAEYDFRLQRTEINQMMSYGVEFKPKQKEPLHKKL